MSKFVKNHDYPELKKLTEAFVALELAHESYKQAREQCAQAKSEFEQWRDNTGLRDSRSYSTTLDERFGEYLAWSMRETCARNTLSGAHILITKQLPEIRWFLSQYRKRPAAVGFSPKAMVTLDLNFAEACDLLAESKILLARSVKEPPTSDADQDRYIETYLQARFAEASEICTRICGT